MFVPPVSQYGPFAAGPGLFVRPRLLDLDGAPRHGLAWVAGPDQWPVVRGKGRLVVPRGLAQLRHGDRDQLGELAIPLQQPVRIGALTLMALPSGVGPGCAQLQLHVQQETWLVATCTRWQPLPGAGEPVAEETARVLVYCPPTAATSQLNDLRLWLHTLPAAVRKNGVLQLAQPSAALALAAVWPGPLRLSAALRARLRGLPQPQWTTAPPLHLALLSERRRPDETAIIDPSWSAADTGLPGLAFSVAAAGPELVALCQQWSPEILVAHGPGAAALAQQVSVTAVLEAAGQLPLLDA